MIWHHVKAFTQAELAARAGRAASVELAFDLAANYYQFRVTAESREGLVDVLRFVGTQVDRMLEDVQHGQ